MTKFFTFLMAVAFCFGTTSCGGDDDEPKNPGTDDTENGSDKPDSSLGIIELNPSEKQLVGFWEVKNLYQQNTTTTIGLFPNGLASIGGHAEQWKYDEATETLVTDTDPPRNIISISAIFDNSWSGYFMNASGRQINITASRSTLTNYAAKQALSTYLSVYSFSMDSSLEFYTFKETVIHLEYDMETLIATGSQWQQKVTINKPWSEHPVMKFKGKEYIGEISQ
ncbi:MAG: hypothetical protein K2H14_00820 [Muribaculaceae bacterium]|nr:hypothetical protein [Muribaculaceae bacterium]